MNILVISALYLEQAAEWKTGTIYCTVPLVPSNTDSLTKTLPLCLWQGKVSKISAPTVPLSPQGKSSFFGSDHPANLTPHGKTHRTINTKYTQI